MFSSDRSTSMDSSASALPSNLLELPVFYDDRDREVAIAYREHLFAVSRIILRVTVVKGDPQLCVMLARLLAIGTAGLGVEYNVQIRFPFFIELELTLANAASVAERSRGCKE